MLVAASAAAYCIGPRNRLGMLRNDRHREGTPQVAERASDVVLARLDGATSPLLDVHFPGVSQPETRAESAEAEDR